jgi:hypothetical protein
VPALRVAYGQEKVLINSFNARSGSRAPEEGGEGSGRLGENPSRVSASRRGLDATCRGVGEGRGQGGLVNKLGKDVGWAERLGGSSLQRASAGESQEARDELRAGDVDSELSLTPSRLKASALQSTRYPFYTMQSTVLCGHFSPAPPERPHLGGAPALI